MQTQTNGTSADANNAAQHDQGQTPPAAETESNLKAELEAAEEIIEAKDRVIQSLEEQITAKNTEIEGLKIKLSAADVRQSISIDAKNKPVDLSGLTVTIKGKKYRFLKPAFNVEGDVYKAEEAKFRPELIIQILNITGQQILQEVV